MNIHFEEDQKFTQWWSWTLIIGITFIPAYGIYKQIFKGEPFGDKPLPDFGLILFLLFILAFIVFFGRIQLSTVINDDSIHINYFPFTNQHIRWKEIKSAEVINYGFVGGWGLRLGTKHGTVYNIRGNKGLALELKDGRKLCIGTQKENELAVVIKEASRQQKFNQAS